MADDELEIGALRTRAQAVLGEDLSALSLEDLAARRAALQAEISRVEAVMAQKQSGRAAAEAVFKRP